ncbi:extracellular solute-binding protein [Demequina sp. SYSU T00192]|uniref:Extracellular solute-binding protein n=1 Tax=Demequina litoralis TaxID=3051660 RepID=A0ABT8G745_9MICO|nr:extracellular solute-binding protein [Demequina sp. SYSU T00192]MDN4474817.1 extracellular solute-binding protein [Demequina sp. SYSU T00192]
MRNTIGKVAVVATSVALLAACSSGTTEETPSSAAPAASESEAAIDATGLTLTVWVDENRKPAVEAAAEQFETDTGATVELVQKNFEDIRTDFLAQVPTGKGPDITIGANDWLGELVEAGVVNTVDLGDKAGSFEQVALDALTLDGQLYGVPFFSEAIALIANMDLVADEAPATWDDMIAMGEESGANRPVVFTTSMGDGDAYHLYPVQTSFGAPVFAQDDTGAFIPEVAMGGENGEAFATWLSEQAEAGNVSANLDNETAYELFASGKSPYIITGPWAMTIGGFDGLDMQVYPVPGAGDEQAAPFVGVQGFYVSSQSENTLLANEFLTNYMATQEAQQTLYDLDPRIPVFEGVGSDDKPWLQGFVDAAAQGVLLPSIPEMGEVWSRWNAAESKIINGADPVKTWNAFVTDLEKAIS